MSGAVPSVEALVELTSECRTRQEYEAARLEWLERAIGFDASYFGAALPEAVPPAPTVSGVDARYTARCEAQADRYWPDRLTLNEAALRSGGAVCDQAAFSAQARDAMPFYREVIGGLGIRAIALCVLRAQGKSLGCLYLGRVSRGARFGRELEQLKRALPALALGKRLFEAEPLPPAVSAAFNAPLTHREAEVLRHLTRGATNPQIALRLGSSPKTVKNQVASILVKSGARNRTELVYLATCARSAADSSEPGFSGERTPRG
jgi:DNA-binding CsgD family transcriptional regulator